MSTDLTVAKTIQEQIGHKAFFMLGARHLVGSNTSLSFRIRGSLKANSIRITLSPLDTYIMEFYKIHGMASKLVAYHENVYCDQLNMLIKKETGLNTNL